MIAAIVSSIETTNINFQNSGVKAGIPRKNKRLIEKGRTKEREITVKAIGEISFIIFLMMIMLIDVQIAKIKEYEIHICLIYQLSLTN